MTDLTQVPWRTGRTLGRTVYARTGGEDYKADTCIGVLDTPALAAEACAAHNERPALSWLLSSGLEVTVGIWDLDGEPGYIVRLDVDSRPFKGDTLAGALDLAKQWAEANGYGP